MTTNHPPPQFPPRPASAGEVSPPYTPAELRLIHYVNSVRRGSDNVGTELQGACERLPGLARYFGAEHDERTDFSKPSPIVIAPTVPSPASVPLCQAEPLSSCGGACLETSDGTCRGA